MSAALDEMETLLRRLREVGTSSDAIRSFDRALRELNSTLAEILERADDRAPPPDIAGPLREALAAIKWPAPVVNMPQMQAPVVNVTPKIDAQLVAAMGARWSISAVRTPKGFDMEVRRIE
jgi:hypothetical protein